MFPPGTMGGDDDYGWGTMFLPQIDQINLFNAVNFDVGLLPTSRDHPTTAVAGVHEQEDRFGNTQTIGRRLSTTVSTDARHTAVAGS